MKQTKLLFILLAAMLLGLCTECSKDNETDDIIPSDLIGTWVIQPTPRITKSYSFSANGTGTYTFSGNSTYYSFPYVFTISGKKIKIKGVYVNDEGTVDPDWHKEGTFSGGVLKIGDDTLTKR